MSFNIANLKIAKMSQTKDKPEYVLLRHKCKDLFRIPFDDFQTMFVRKPDVDGTPVYQFSRYMAEIDETTGPDWDSYMCNHELQHIISDFQYGEQEFIVKGIYHVEFTFESDQNTTKTET